MIEAYSRLLDLLSEKKALRSDWRPAFDAVPRHLFVPDAVWAENTLKPVVRSDDPAEWLRLVCSDEPVVTQIDDGETPAGQPGRYPSSSTSMPSLVAMMLDRARLSPGMQVLEIGTGTGWNTGLLCARLGSDNVTSIEIDSDIAAQARISLSVAGFSPTIINADGGCGYVPGAPYHVVLATCGVRQVPYAWVEQSPGGRIITPWRTAYYNGALLVLDVAEGIASGRFVGDAAFMSMRAQRRLWDGPAGGGGDAEEGTTGLHPYALLSNADAAFAVGLRVPDCHTETHFHDEPPHANYTTWVHDPDSGSWAAVSVSADTAEKCPTRQYGPRRLWDEVEAAYAWWLDAGRPERTRFGLTITPHGQWTWLNTPAHRVP